MSSYIYRLLTCVILVPRFPLQVKLLSFYMDLGVDQSDLRKCTALAHGTHHYKNQSGTTFVKCEGTKLTASGMR